MVGTLARRFPLDIGPFAGMAAQSQAAYDDLALLSNRDEATVLFLDQPPLQVNGWHLEVSDQLTQMIYQGSPDVDEDTELIPLMDADVPEMLGLTDLTRPGPFRQRTYQLGTYYGIRVAGQLVAMAGERLKTRLYTEVSAVCTHPDFQGKGYAQRLMRGVIRQIVSDGRVPFLHSRSDNAQAIHVYEKLGFQVRRLIYLGVYRKLET
jgi:ribosomal protein S18 acetylase RimI-like enzyme